MTSKKNSNLSSENLAAYFKSTKLFVVANDAGGANQIASFLFINGISDFNLYCEGPALQIFRRFFPDFKVVTLSDLIESNVLLTGTSAYSSLEHNARMLAHEHGVQSFCYIDHWCLFEERFRRRGSVCLPEAVFLIDECALDLWRKSNYGKIPSLMLGDSFSHYVCSEVNSRKPARTRSILYLCEPFSRRDIDDSSIEFLGFSLFLEWYKKERPDRPMIYLKIHPSETADRYDWITKLYQDLPVSIASEDLSIALTQSDTVVGFQTHALSIALDCGKSVFSCLPNGSGPSLLFHKKIPEFRERYGEP